MPRLLKQLDLTPATPIYNIGAASRLSGLPIWTLRWIEKHALVRPRRTEGNQRLFSERDVETLKAVRELMEKKVNLAGIRVILRLRERGAEGSPTAPRSAPAGRRARP
jgi:DNA-binding transcriptional MerR regulator